MNLSSEHRVQFFSPISIFLLINLIPDIHSEKVHHFPPNPDDLKAQFIMKRSTSTDQNDGYNGMMNSQIMKDLEMRLYQQQPQQNFVQDMAPPTKSLVDLQPSPTIQQRHLMSGIGGGPSQSGYSGGGGGGGGEPGRLPFNALYPYIGSKFLSLFPRKTFHLNPYNPFPFLPNLIPSLSYLPYSNPSYTNSMSSGWGGSNPYYSPFQYQYSNNYNNFNSRYSIPSQTAEQSSPSSFNNGYEDYSNY